MRNALIGLGVTIAVIVTSVMIAASIWPTINRVETGATLEYPQLMPKTYQLGYDRVFDEAVAATKAQGGWTFVSEARDTGLISANAVMPVTGWRHQVTVRVERRSEFVSRVHVISEGSDAPGDLGQNARNIQRVLEELEHRLGAAEVK
jgi:hypothetical protein